ncbi:MAG: tetratricopeptide repeat protein, partial [Ardenticatenaceae bacterium]
MFPDLERRWCQAAEAALTLGDYELVGRLCAAMRADRPHHLDASYYEARLALQWGDLNKAQPLLEQVLRHDPQHWPARWALGVVLLRRGDADRGLARCREAAWQGLE